MIWFDRLTGRKPSVSKALSELNPIDPLPILTASEIISGLRLSQRLKSIERMTGAGNVYFKELYLPAIHQFIESVQLVPASASHHHAGPGGLAAHTLDVIDTALRIRKSYNLPQYSTPEIIYAQEHVWSYAVFAGALLHDIGKVACNARIKLDTGLYWTPHEGSIHETGAKRYQIEFHQSRYKLHTQLANSFFYLLPPKGRGWLTQYPDILAQLTTWLMGDLYESGAVGEIVRQADSHSVAANLKIGGDRTRFAGHSVPMVDRLTTALRQLLDSGQLKINRPDGSAGWCDGQYTYLVCGTTADAVKQHLYAAGATDIPGDNTRLFDVWQDHGYALPTPKGGAIWRLTINGALTLTVLKFETERLFHPSRRPAAFDGELSVVANDEGRTGPQNLGGSPTKPISPKILVSLTPIPAALKSCCHSQQTHQPSTLVYTVHNPIDRDDSDPFGAVSHVNSIDTVPQPPGTAPSTPETIVPEPTPPSAAPTSFTLDDPDIAHYFLDWLRRGLRDGKIYTNRSTALIHIVKEGVLIVSPLAFKNFIRSHPCLLESGKNEDKITVIIQDKLKRMMTMANFHRQTEKGLNIHSYQINGANKTASVRGWLLPVAALYGEMTPPAMNAAMDNVSGFKGDKKAAKKG